MKRTFPMLLARIILVHSVRQARLCRALMCKDGDVEC